MIGFGICNIIYNFLGEFLEIVVLQYGNNMGNEDMCVESFCDKWYW